MPSINLQDSVSFWFFKVEPSQIYLIKFLLEAYENWMVVSTIDPKLAKIQIMIANDFQKECLAIIQDLQKEFSMIEMDFPPDKSQALY